MCISLEMRLDDLALQMMQRRFLSISVPFFFLAVRRAALNSSTDLQKKPCLLDT